MSARTEKRIQTRERIIEVASSLFQLEGFQGANLDAVAKEAGIAKGTVYRYFRSKGELYIAVVTQNSKAFFEGAEEHVASTREMSAADRVRALWSAYSNHWSRYPDELGIFWAIDNLELLGDLPEGLADRIAENWKRALKLTQNVLDDGVASGEIIPIDTWKGAQAFWTLANSLIEHDSVRSRRIVRARPFHETYEFSIELLLRGMLTDPGQSRLETQSSVDSAATAEIAGGADENDA